MQDIWIVDLDGSDTATANPALTMTLTRTPPRMTPLLPPPTDGGSIKTSRAWSRHV